MTVIFHRLAVKDFVQARRWYARRSLWAESQFVQSVQTAIARLEASPYSGTRFNGQFYWVRARRFPYVLYYEIINQNLAKVYAIAHKRRRPGYWMGRTRRP